MSIIATQICEQFELLSDEERMQVLHTLWKSVPVESDDEMEELVSTAESRSAEMTSGRVQGVPWTDVQKQLDQVLAS